jgi:hypothetical protein
VVDLLKEILVVMVMETQVVPDMHMVLDLTTDLMVEKIMEIIHKEEVMVEMEEEFLDIME